MAGGREGGGTVKRADDDDDGVGGCCCRYCGSCFCDEGVNPLFMPLFSYMLLFLLFSYMASLARKRAMVSVSIFA